MSWRQRGTDKEESYICITSIILIIIIIIMVTVVDQSLGRYTQEILGGILKHNMMIVDMTTNV